MMEIMPIILWLRDHIGPLMMFTFLLIVATTFWPGRKKSFDQASRIPLDDDR
jgi:cbb3-type cytochrome oxidase subunit 3